MPFFGCCYFRLYTCCCCCFGWSNSQCIQLSHYFTGSIQPKCQKACFVCEGFQMNLETLYTQYFNCKWLFIHITLTNAYIVNGIEVNTKHTHKETYFAYSVCYKVKCCVREFDKNAVVINEQSRKQIIYGLENTFCVSENGQRNWKHQRVSFPMGYQCNFIHFQCHLALEVQIQLFKNRNSLWPLETLRPNISIVKCLILSHGLVWND